jgi:hypothetical protein
MTIGKGKRPRDPNQLAAWTVAVSTGQIPEPQPEVPKVTGSAAPANISEYTAAIGRKGGQIGGKRRLKTMTKAQRSKIARPRLLRLDGNAQSSSRCPSLQPYAHFGTS